MWPILPAGQHRVASGTLQSVTRRTILVLLFAALAAAPPVALAAALPAEVAATQAPASPPAATAGEGTVPRPGTRVGALQCAGPRPSPPVGERSRPACGVPAVVHRAGTGTGARAGAATGGGIGFGVTERGRPPEAAIRWRRSRALGRTNHGRLVGGVELPAAGTNFVTVDPVTGTSPNRAWRRNGTDRLLQMLLRVAEEHAAAHPGAPRLVVGDLSRPHGGRFGPEYGGDGHRSHQNGLDADVYYPRRDGLERIPTRVGQIDRRLAQELVNRFVHAGAQYVFVGPATGLHGPTKVVMTLANHDDHLHVRIRPGAPSSR